MDNQNNTEKIVKFSKSNPTVYIDSKQSQTSKDVKPPVKPKETKQNK